VAILTLNASPTGWANQSSAVGVAPWYTVSSVPQTALPQGAGSSWIVWSIPPLTAIPPGDAFNGLLVSGTNDFTVGGGGVGKTRQATLYMNLLRSFAFTGTSGTAMSTLVGSGSGVALNYTFPTSGFTGNDFRNGVVFLGVYGNSDGGDAGQGDGTLRFNSLVWTIYTGTDTTTPPAGNVAGTFTNPTANNLPGVFPGGVFTGLTFVYAQPKPNSLATATFVISGTTKLAWTSGGQSVGLDCSSTHSYSCTTPNISIAADTPPGTYQISMQVNNGSSPIYTQWTTVVVRQRPDMFMAEA
jgi:hypothetical protein